MDLIDFARYLAALMLVLALVGFAGLAARRFGIPGLAKGMSARRLALVESLMVGPRQRLYLVRRDGVEHLIFAGPDGASVVETAIPSPPPALAAPAAPAFSQ